MVEIYVKRYTDTILKNRVFQLDQTLLNPRNGKLPEKKTGDWNTLINLKPLIV